MPAMREEDVLFVGRVTGHNRVSSEKMCVYFRVLMHFHFLIHVSIDDRGRRENGTYHLEGVELFFDLLSQHWS